MFMSTFNESQHNRQSAGTSIGGQFANKDHPANDGVGLGEPSRILSPEAVERLDDGDYTPEDFEGFKSALLDSLTEVDEELVFVDYDDSLSNEQVDMLLAGDRDEVWEDMGERWMFEQRADRAEDLARERSEDLGVAFDNLSHLDQLDLLTEIQDRDTSDPLSELQRTTGEVLMRHSVVPSPIWHEADPELAEKANRSVYLDDEAGPARVKILEDALIKNGTIAGPLSGHDRDSLAEMVSNGPEYLHAGVSLDAIWYGEIGAATLDYEKSDRTVVSEEGIGMVLIDSWNGSGFDSQFRAPVSMTFTKDNHAQLDATRPGYGSWDSIAGVVHSAYRADVTDKKN